MMGPGPPATVLTWGSSSLARRKRKTVPGQVVFSSEQPTTSGLVSASTFWRMASTRA